MLTRFRALTPNWTASPQRILIQMQLPDELYNKVFRIYSYALHQNNTDLGNSDFIAIKGAVQSLLTELSASVAFLASDIRKLGDK